MRLILQLVLSLLFINYKKLQILNISKYKKVNKKSSVLRDV